MSLRLSVVIITHNDADMLTDCLASVSWADEIVLLDAGSNDDTLTVARAAGAKIAVNTDWQGYGVQRQRAQQLASGDYIFMLDADERVTPSLALAIQQVLIQQSRAEQNKTDFVYSVGRLNWFLGRFMRHSGWYPDRVVRLYPRRYQYSEHLVHESLVIQQAKVLPLSGDLLHITCRDLATFQRKQLNYAHAWAQEYHRQGKRAGIFSALARALVAGLKTLILRGGVLDGYYGWLLTIINAQYTFNKYAILWALNQQNNNQKALREAGQGKEIIQPPAGTHLSELAQPSSLQSAKSPTRQP